MPKRTDMGSRYAGAHARSEQRRKQAASREFLPLATEPSMTLDARPIGARPIGGFRGVPAPAISRLPSMDYSYLRGDLTRTAILAVALFALMIVLSIFVHP